MSVTIDSLVRSRRRTIALIIQRDGSLTVRAPLLITTAQVQQFVESHERWIRRKQAHVHTTLPPKDRQFAIGEKFLFLGKEYPLAIVTSKKPSLCLDGGKFCLASTSLPKARQVFIHWYKTRALEVILARMEYFSARDGFSWQKVRISSARSRWGSCSAQGTLSFTWRLVMAPRDVIDYVIIHELVHTQIKDHSPRFWKKVAGFMPEYKRWVSWLKKNGNYLSLSSD
jgi:predicted metal-dependent hydrolase